MSDRVTFNEPGDWLGPDYALGLVDEIVVSDAMVHFEMLGDPSAYMVVARGDRQVLARFHARPTTWGERRQILASNQERLRDELACLIPNRWGGRRYWSISAWRRPAACVRSWWRARRAAGSVLCVRVDENDLIPDEAP